MLPERLALLEKIQSKADVLTKKIHEAATTATNEWEFRRKFANLIEELAKELGIQLQVKEERTLAAGRLDAAYNRIIIEYKTPGILRPSLGHRQTQESLQQLRDYMTAVADEQHLQLERLFGLVVDGKFFIFVRYANQQWQKEDPVPVNQHTTARFLKLLFSLVSGKALTPTNLADDFGSKNDIAPQFAQSLYAALANTSSPLVKTLFNQWTTFFGEVTGYEEGSVRLRDKPELKKFAQEMGIEPGLADPPRLFFAVHTYYALLIKFIAWLALSRFVSPFGGANLLTLSGLESGQLQARLREMERGGIFRTLRIRNFRKLISSAGIS